MPVELFKADDGVHGQELWRTDGTAAGTWLVKDISPGPEASYPDHLTEVGGIVYFVAQAQVGGISHTNLWRSDGTANGTYALTTGDNGAFPFPLIAVDQYLYFYAYNASGAHSLYITDGTAAGTRELAPVEGAGNFVAVDHHLMFTADDGVHGTELWISDGTVSGTRMAQDLKPGSGGSIRSEVVYPGGYWGFFAADDGVHGVELFLSAPSANQAQLVADLYAGGGSNPHALTVAGGKVFFQTTLDDQGANGLWVTGGYAGTTVRLAGNLANSGARLTAAGDHLYYVTADGALHVTDGTVAGSQTVGSLSGVSAVLAVGVGAAAVVDASASGLGEGLYVTDGTTAGTTRIASGYIIGGQFQANGHLYFMAHTEAAGTELWVSDGAAAGTHILADLAPGAASTSVHAFGVLDGQLLFSLGTGAVWTSDGTAAGTHEVFGALNGVTEFFTTLRAFDPPAHDLDASGTDDILWRNDSGELYFYTMQSPDSWNSGSLGSVPTNWHVVDMGDYTGDGRADVLWRNDDGDVYIWNSVSGPGVHFAGQSISHVDNAWHAVAQAGDFNGDGRTDILWRNDSGEVYVWNSNTGADVSFVGQSLGMVGNNWQIQGVGDFNGDGRADVLWREAGGDTYVWLDSASGPVAMGGQSISSTPNDWQIQGVGDFNGDGREDVLWRHDDGELYVWNSRTDSDAVNFVGQSLGMVDLAWSVAAIGDYDGDGRADILFRNGAITYGWFSNGSTGPEHFFGRALANVTSDWHILSDFHGL